MLRTCICENYNPRYGKYAQQQKNMSAVQTCFTVVKSRKKSIIVQPIHSISFCLFQPMSPLPFHSTGTYVFTNVAETSDGGLFWEGLEKEINNDVTIESCLWDTRGARRPQTRPPPTPTPGLSYIYAICAISTINYIFAHDEIY